MGTGQICKKKTLNEETFARRVQFDQRRFFTNCQFCTRIIKTYKCIIKKGYRRRVRVERLVKIEK